MANNNDDGVRPRVAEQIELISSTENEEGGNKTFRLTPLNQPLSETEMVAIAVAISQSTQVEVVRLGPSCRLGASPAAATSTFLKNIFKTHPSLRKIDLHDNNLDDNLAEAIGLSLKTNTSLKELILSWNKIGNQGAEALADGLRYNRSLQRINLELNQVGDRGATAFANVLCISKTLEVLNLDNNNVTGEGGKALASALEKSTLKALCLGGSALQDEGGKAFAQSLYTNKSLTELNLGDTDISDETCEALAAALCNNSSLRGLILRRNARITNVGVAALEGILKHLNFSVERILLYDISGVTRDQRDWIHQLCARNARVNTFFQQVNQNIPTIPFGVWPNVLEAVECKPDLLFALLKTNPEVCQQL